MKIIAWIYLVILIFGTIISGYKIGAERKPLTWKDAAGTVIVNLPLIYFLIKYLGF